MCGPSPKPIRRKTAPATRKVPSWHQNPGSPTVRWNRCFVNGLGAGAARLSRYVSSCAVHVSKVLIVPLCLLAGNFIERSNQRTMASSGELQQAMMPMLTRDLTTASKFKKFYTSPLKSTNFFVHCINFVIVEKNRAF